MNFFFTKHVEYFPVNIHMPTEEFPKQSFGYLLKVSPWQTIAQQLCYGIFDCTVKLLRRVDCVNKSNVGSGSGVSE